VEIAAAGADFIPAVQLAVAVVAGEAVSGKRLYRALPGWAGTAVGIVLGDLLGHLSGRRIWSSVAIC
jgi:hypothetical protein